MGVSNNIKPDKNIQNPKNKEDNFQVQFINELWLKGCSIKKKRWNFTNKYNNYEDMSKYLVKTMTDLLLDLQTHGNDIFNKRKIYFQRTHHCHIISSEKEDIVKAIINEIYDNSLDVESDSDNKVLWQYGTNQDLRLICLYDKSNNTIYPLFLDPFHLIHASVKHNEEDHMTNNLCPIKGFN